MNEHGAEGRLSGPSTLPFGFTEGIKANDQGWLEVRANQLISTRVPASILNSFFSLEEMHPNRLIALELERGLDDGKLYLWVTYTEKDLPTPSKRYLPRFSREGARIVKYCGSEKFGILCFDGDVKCEDIELAELHDGLRVLREKAGTWCDFSFFGERPAKALVVDNDYNTFALEIVVYAFDGTYAYGVHENPGPGDIPLLRRNVMHSFVEGVAMANADWKPFTCVDGKVTVEAIVRPYHVHDATYSFVSVHVLANGTNQLGQIVVISGESRAENFWHDHRAVLFALRPDGRGEQNAWTRFGDELIVESLRYFLTE